jgi:hypothetical protein
VATFLTRTTTTYQSESRPWLLGQEGTKPGDNPTATLDISAFTAGTHYPNGYIPNGTVVSRLVSGLWGPFDNVAASGEHGILYGSITIPNLADLTQDAAGALVRNNANVDFNRLPTGGRPTLAQARTQMPRIQFDDVTP